MDRSDCNVNSPRKVLIVDGMALLFRAYFATSFDGYIRKTSAGVPTNAIYGLIQYLFDAIHKFKPTHVVCCWDMGSTTFRTEIYDSYKGNRPAPPAELIPQFDLVKEVVADLGIPNVGVHGYEADDCMGTLAQGFSRDAHVYILTGDHDMLQLINEQIHVIIMKKGRSNYAVYDHATLLNERGITPEQVVELKSFMGDTSDNYPGVRGIGEKTALKLLADFQSVEGVLENLHLLPKGVRTKIETDLELLHLSRKLARIRTDVPVSCELDACAWSIQRETAVRRFEELEFGGLVKLIG
jgi:5'-3' exonuclease